MTIGLVWTVASAVVVSTVADISLVGLQQLDGFVFGYQDVARKACAG